MYTVPTSNDQRGRPDNRAAPFLFDLPVAAEPSRFLRAAPCLQCRRSHGVRPVPAPTAGRRSSSHPSTGPQSSNATRAHSSATRAAQNVAPATTLPATPQAAATAMDAATTSSPTTAATGRDPRAPGTP